MLKNLIILSLCLVAIEATGELTILGSPKSLSFKGSEPIHSDAIGDLVYVAMGNPVTRSCHWSGLIIKDPFELPTSALLVTLTGINHSNVADIGKTYSVKGETFEPSLNYLTANLQADNKTVCAIRCDQVGDSVLSLKNTNDDIKIPNMDKTKYVNGDIQDDNQYLGSISCLKAVADNFPDIKKKCSFTHVSLSAADVGKTHGDNEAKDPFSDAIKYLNTVIQKHSNNEVLAVVAVNEADGKSRSKRETTEKDDKNEYNLADYYNQDYPVIFNIILWLMVVFGLSLLAICYAIGTMDPGRDSIIYRMTSTRMKKDN